MNQPANNLTGAVVLGAAAVDLVIRVPVLPQADEIVLADSLQSFPGGSGGNVACGVARLGHSVSFLGKVGDDADGRWLLRAFAEENVDTRFMRLQTGARTASCFIAVDGQGRRVIYSLGGTAILESPQELEVNCIASARLLFIADAIISVAALACQIARTNQAMVVFAPGGLMISAGKASLEPVLEQAEVFIANQTEALNLTQERDPARAAARLASWGPQVVMITLGEQGALLLEGSHKVHIPPRPVKVVRDTTGAGDAFAAGVVAGYLAGLDWEAAAAQGCAAAAAKITQLGARSGFPRQEQPDKLDQSRKGERGQL